MPCNSSCRTFWKKQHYGDSIKLSGCQGLGKGGRAEWAEHGRVLGQIKRQIYRKSLYSPPDFQCEPNTAVKKITMKSIKKKGKGKYPFRALLLMQDVSRDPSDLAHGRSPPSRWDPLRPQPLGPAMRYREGAWHTAGAQQALVNGSKLSLLHTLKRSSRTDLPQPPTHTHPPCPPRPRMDSESKDT